MKYGYACINLSLINCKSGHTITRTSFNNKGLNKGLNVISDLILLNINDLQKILEWNINNGIYAYRIPDDFFPLKSFYDYNDLPKFDLIKNKLKQIGDYCNNNDIRLSFHPGPFNILSSANNNVVERTLIELNKTSDIFDLMNFIPSHYNKINIHCGGAYGNKLTAMDRFCENFLKLNENTRKRLTIENDDKCGLYCVEDLLYIYNKIGIPIVLDVLHHIIHPGSIKLQDAFDLTLKTWKRGIIPIIHYSSSKLLFESNNNKIRKQAHADYIYEKVDTFNHDVDIIFECKMKDIAVLKYIKDFK